MYFVFMTLTTVNSTLKHVTYSDIEYQSFLLH